ncbi:UNKNOWN [Stylonychia lemnae]|uniref:Uncharacterized protein n=1 Tax=Stylonychia lemnae TaxID=5949 RepID=A0A078APL5_STYLE|nr:UNKNOWN [Stylonychia lemnae]|eukprot:CDW83896.1 UNKNOWN [Stylonychia lemnae]
MDVIPKSYLIKCLIFWTYYMYKQQQKPLKDQETQTKLAKILFALRIFYDMFALSGFVAGYHLGTFELEALIFMISIMIFEISGSVVSLRESLRKNNSLKQTLLYEQDLHHYLSAKSLDTLVQDPVQSKSQNCTPEKKFSSKDSMCSLSSSIITKSCTNSDESNLEQPKIFKQKSASLLSPPIKTKKQRRYSMESDLVVLNQSNGYRK